MQEAMTEREAVDIIKDSSLWEDLSKREKAEAISYAIEIAKRNIKREIESLNKRTRNS
jgi:hypothetical protein